MKIKELEEKIKEIKENNKDIDISELEIGPLFNNGVIMMTTDIYLVDDAAWEDTKEGNRKAIAIEWMA
jgi:hypothetical protein